jgi:hypothetical protein
VLYVPMDWTDIAWQVIACCSWISLILMLAAVGIGGQYMLQKYRYRQRNVHGKRGFSREGRLRLALIVFCLGLGLQVTAIVLANVVPGHH